MANERISVEDLLSGQEKAAFSATVEAVEGKPEFVKVTPWTAGVGCLCHMSIQISKQSLAGVTPTGETHVCCGKTLKVVELHFKKDEAIKLEDVFGQLGRSAGGEGHGAHERYEVGQHPVTYPPIEPPGGWPIHYPPVHPDWPPLSYRPHRRAMMEERFGLPESCSTRRQNCVFACRGNLNCINGCYTAHCIESVFPPSPYGF